ncbi:MAG: cupin [Microcoleaceae cyanobacterium]
MQYQDWLVTESGEYSACKSAEITSEPDRPYRLYRFLSDLEDILYTVEDEPSRLKQIFPRVRQLLTDSYWLQGEFREPDPDLGWSVLTLYEEPDFPLTIQNVVWLPGQTSPVHNHATWGVVAILSGSEKNRLWRRTPNPEFPDKIELVDEITLSPGEIIGFTSDAVHQVEVLEDSPTITFNLYGKTDFASRFEFDLTTHQAKNF